MSDDLLKRLAEYDLCDPTDLYRVDRFPHREALARIEAAEAALLAANDLARECDRIAPIVGEAIEAHGLGDPHGIATANAFRARLSAYRARRATGGGE